MDFVALIIFLALYYLRPQEWFAEFNALRPVELLSIVAFWAMFQGGKLKPRDLVRTPLDWLVLFYFLWTLIAGDHFRHTLGSIEAVLLFYFVAVRSLDSVSRQKTFLAWWCFFILVIAALSIASQYGFDPLHSEDIIQGQMKGRLILNLSIFNNPNALGHSVIPCVPLLYYLLFWRRTFMRAGLLLIALPLYCIFLTQSKGAFLCGFATILATLVFGRSKPVQIVILFVALMFGYGVLYTLPRMDELQHSKSDPAIQGRVAALSYGLQLMQTHFFGIGLGNFPGMFTRYGPTETIRKVQIIPAHDVTGNEGAVQHVGAKRLVSTQTRHFLKSTHGAYNQNGAELGYVGLFLFVGILYCCVRTLVLMRCVDNDEERIRRALFATVVAYAVSSWMVDFGYRPTFFLFVAAISAFHRHLLRNHGEDQEPVGEKTLVPARPWLRRLPPLNLPGIPIPGMTASLPAGFPAGMAPAAIAPLPLQPAVLPGAAGSGRILPWHKPQGSFKEIIFKKFIWTRLGVMDYLIMLALTYASVLYWEHLIATM
jgi:hypothetical protein